ncbi:DUF4878 domain-containing protein [Gordonia sp. PP30]|uniref:DUF4878 domain-containing protein n=1 Tax=Gordonia sp. PP30 TaxID=2935861 RepID=UPI00200000CD|nr:DUF4878 domain-containing protein [Gordonia sp. PP30]UQE74414.1 DUF4878 domain-containing protein [Gordonia sp. PP30]
MQKNLRRPVLAVVTLAAGAAIALTGCSSDSGDTAAKASSAATSATDSVKSAVEGLDVAKAQEILRKAVDPATPADQIDSVVDVTNPATKAAIIGYAKGSAAGGYTPDVYTVSSVTGTDKVDGHDAAKVVITVKSPHAPQPVEMTDNPLVYVKVDGTWKLSGDAVTQLSSMAGSHGGH